jgi:two-component system sensor histidine kinase DegS
MRGHSKITKRSGKSGKIPEHSGTPAEDDGLGGEQVDFIDRWNFVEMLINAAESERQRLSRQMHDGPAQALSNFILQTEIAMRLLDVDPAQVRNELSNLKVAAMNTFQKVRSYIFELRPMMLDDLGLAPTIKKYADQIKEQAGVDINVSITGNDQRMESYLEVIYSGQCRNCSVCRQQNQATLVKIQLDRSDTGKLSLDDNGKGFDTDALVKDANLGIKLIKIEQRFGRRF